MISSVEQRWRDGRPRWVAHGPVFDPKHHEVAEIMDDSTAKRFVTEHHYSGSYPPARRRFGLYDRGELVGVSVLSVPMQPAATAKSFACGPDDVAELGRFVLLDRVAFNAESWFWARARERLRGFVAGLVSFADPVPRCQTDGTMVFPGHVGQIYQASNAVEIRSPRGPEFDAVSAIREEQDMTKRTKQSFGDHAAHLVRPHLDDEGMAEWLEPKPLYSRLDFLRARGVPDDVVRAVARAWDAWHG